MAFADAFGWALALASGGGLASLAACLPSAVPFLPHLRCSLHQRPWHFEQGLFSIMAPFFPLAQSCRWVQHTSASLALARHGCKTKEQKTSTVACAGSRSWAKSGLQGSSVNSVNSGKGQVGTLGAANFTGSANFTSSAKNQRNPMLKLTGPVVAIILEGLMEARQDSVAAF